MRIFAVSCLTLLSACGGFDSQTIAVHQAGTIEVSDLDSYIRLLPEANRVRPSNESHPVWLEKQIKNLAVSHALKADPVVMEKLQSIDARNRQTWAIVLRLAQTVRAQIGATTEPIDEAWQAERLAFMSAQNEKVTFYNFRHILLRTDKKLKFKTVAEAKAQAEDIVSQARNGEDFVQLVKTHSQSADAASGGLVENNRRIDLDPNLFEILDRLSEGAVSDVVTTRTGLHIFKLERKISPEFDQPAALKRIQQEWDTQQRSQILQAFFENRHATFQIVTDENSWSSETWSLDRNFVIKRAPAMAANDMDVWIVQQLILAEEGKSLGQLTDALQQQVERAVENEILTEAFSEKFNTFMEGIKPERFRSFYDASPSGFGKPESAEIQLIFVAKGTDSFATQQSLEPRVSDLRAGASFAELAQQISIGPNAESGGNLGSLTPREWSRLHPEIYKAILNLNEGETSDPVFCTDKVISADERLLRGGFAIIKVVSKSAASVLPFEDVVDKVRQAYLQANIRSLEEEFQQTFLAQSGFKLVRVPQASELAQ